MRIAFEQLVAEYPVFADRYCSDEREDRQNIMMLSAAVWAIDCGHEVEVLWDPDTSNRRKGIRVVFLVLFSVAAYQLKNAIDAYRKREDCLVIVCGPHAVSFPGHCLSAGADSVVGRCNRDLFLSILADIQCGQLKPSYSTTRPVTEFPHYVRFKELSLIPEQGFMNVLSSTGCPYDCAFCTDAETPYSRQDPQDVLLNIESSDDELVVLNDPTFGVGRESRALLRELPRIKQRSFVAFTTSSMLRDKEFRQLLSGAGFVMVEVGIENINSTFSKNGAADFASLFSECDFMVLANYIFGYDPRDFLDDTLAFLQKLVDRCPNVLPMIFCPFSLPETPLHKQKLSNGLIFDPSYLCIGNEILSLQLPEAVSPHLYYETVNSLNDRLYDGHASRLREWIECNPRIGQVRKGMMLRMVARQQLVANRFTAWMDLIQTNAPEQFVPFSKRVLQNAVPRFEEYDLAMEPAKR
jgi:hypothetical protein